MCGAPRRSIPPGGVSPEQNWRGLPMRNFGQIENGICGAYCQEGCAIAALARSAARMGSLIAFPLRQRADVRYAFCKRAIIARVVFAAFAGFRVVFVVLV
jgi:hypothetical protein